ncbi:hypothetical protein F5B22DRAFT_138516 [Xylaria bambusicola]|uniref:uncharacterized protein n=1 Tax=Xylaria bambusicola TaxID=326684 RepID=UPI0020081154|nr:uncharacterized protein F5B22DRAFT_138516 [Xylaria bambusicola]KAI0516954.1 hypothetical protein F5B22DRAFT_138516 [Xylaria bambusicola]
MSNFRVIILGAGPAGLFTAHGLTAAGIDYVVLERQPEIVRYKGALIVLWPPLLRLLDQLGIYESVKQLSTPLPSQTKFTHSGEPLCGGDAFVALEHELGYPTLGLSRGNLIRTLYETLPERATKVRANANVVNIETHKDGVRVHLADGSGIDGSIVIAGDGVHSPTRELIQRLRHDSSATGDLKPTDPMVANFMSLFGHTRSDRTDIAMGDFAESHGPGIASQSARLRDAIYFTVVKRLEKPVSDKRSFTTEEINKFAQEMSDVTVFPGVKLKEIWPLREETNAVLLHQEEGMAEKWHHGRIVLVGDAAHKMTSMNGQGALSAILSATVLINSLRATLKKNPRPSTQELEMAFTQYETSRKGAVKPVLDLGVFISRFITWMGEETEAMDREVSRDLNLVEDSLKKLLPLFTPSPIFDFLPFEGKQGHTPWEVDSKPPIRARL